MTEVINSSAGVLPVTVAIVNGDSKEEGKEVKENDC
jgi:hypothetical protein